VPRPKKTGREIEVIQVFMLAVVVGLCCLPGEVEEAMARRRRREMAYDIYSVTSAGWDGESRQNGGLLGVREPWMPSKPVGGCQAARSAKGRGGGVESQRARSCGDTMLVLPGAGR